MAPKGPEAKGPRNSKPTPPDRSRACYHAGANQQVGGHTGQEADLLIARGVAFLSGWLLPGCARVSPRAGQSWLEGREPCRGGGPLCCQEVEGLFPSGADASTVQGRVQTWSP